MPTFSASTAETASCGTDDTAHEYGPDDPAHESEPSSQYRPAQEACPAPSSQQPTLPSSFREMTDLPATDLVSGAACQQCELHFLVRLCSTCGCRQALLHYTCALPAACVIGSLHFCQGH